MRGFWTDENGATTVDWVVLAASAGAMALSVTALLSDGVSGVGAQVESTLDGIEVAQIALSPGTPPNPVADPPPPPPAQEVADDCADCLIIVVPNDNL